METVQRLFPWVKWMIEGYSLSKLPRSASILYVFIFSVPTKLKYSGNGITIHFTFTGG